MTSRRFALPLFLFLFALAFSATASAKDPLAGRIGIAAVVNDEAVTFSDLRNRMALMLLGARGEPPPEVRKQIEDQILTALIDERLQMQAAKNLGVLVDDGQVKEGFARIAGMNKLSGEEFRQKLSSAGVNPATLDDKVRAEIAWGQVVRRKLRPQITVTENEIDSEMDRLARDKGKPEYHIAEILLPVTSPETESLVRQDADKIVQQLTKGASFSQVAKEFSQSPGAAQGGDLGWLRAEQMDPVLSNAVVGMKPGQISPPLRTDKGYHILFLRDSRTTGGAPVQRAAPEAPQPEQPRPSLVTINEGNEEILHLMQIIIPVGANDPPAIVNAKTARAEALKSEISGCNAMAQRSKDFLTPGTGDLGKGPLSKLPPPLKDAVATLPDGKLSNPVLLPTGVAVLMVCGRMKAKTETARAPVAPEPAPAPEPAAQAAPEAEAAAPGPSPSPAMGEGADDSRDQIATQLGMQRLQQMAERYLKDLRATAYIDKRF